MDVTDLLVCRILLGANKGGLAELLDGNGNPSR